MAKMSYSIKERITRILLTFLAPFFLLLVIYNYYVINTVKNSGLQYVENSLQIYSSSLENDLQVVDDYMDYFIRSDMDFRKLVYAQTERKAIAKLGDVNEKLKPLYNLVSGLSGHIIYQPHWNQMKSYFVPSASYSAITKKKLQDFLMEKIEEIPQFQEERWMTLEAEGQTYLIHFWDFKGTAILGIFDLKMIEDMYNSDQMDNEYFLRFVDDEKRSLVSRQYLEELDREEYVCAEEEIQDLGIWIVYGTLVYKQNIIGKIPFVFILFSVFLVLLLIYCIYEMYRLCVRPMQDMVNIMKKVREGDLELRCMSDYRSTDFSLVANTFNDMLDQINNLKIASYEQKLEMQRVSLLYRQIQIRPHFLLNCMKNIFSLAQEKNFKEIQDAVVVLSQYIRYVLKDELILVDVRDELNSVKNYIHLQQITSKDSIQYECVVEEEIFPLKIPILSILTFVENSIKHGRKIKTEFIITIVIKVIDEFLNITIRDNGSGFSEEVLEYLNKNKNYRDENEHIGIINVLHRLNIIYGKKCEVAFSNMGGACVEIFIPMGETLEK